MEAVHLVANDRWNRLFRPAAGRFAAAARTAHNPAAPKRNQGKRHMAEPLVTYQVRDRVATITFNRPDKLNAFNDDMTRQALAAMHRFDLDPEADAAVLTGAGRAFSSGARIAGNPPLGVRHAVQLRRWELKKVQQAAIREVGMAKLHLSEDFRESARAFVEKRPPAPFKGR
jgi:enoyl-CoA hydratase/carnithine racemase